ncbi:MAG: polyphosphate polymerase domain-containing protein [Clostridiales bacterium]|nr:polyphosphate polymerase domain-containing protein [Clostridiales bacterium]
MTGSERGVMSMRENQYIKPETVAANTSQNAERAVLYSFQRYETKYLLNQEQYRELLPLLRTRLTQDAGGVYTVCNIYYDTDNFDLIRASIEKPVYKEKFRLRSYGIPDENGIVFAEIKKKFNGIVYKRRIDASPAEIRALIGKGTELKREQQIQRELRCFFRRYRPAPKAFIGYERLALVGREDADLRVTFDWNVRWRDRDLDICAGDYGKPLFEDDRVVMEVKTAAAIPLWLVSLLSQRRIYSTGFSKYGTCYQRYLAQQKFGKGRVKIYA